jgi:hypothetical protein
MEPPQALSMHFGPFDGVHLCMLCYANTTHDVKNSVKKMACRTEEKQDIWKQDLNMLAVPRVIAEASAGRSK